MRRRTFLYTMASGVCLLAGNAYGITGGPADFVCPLCKTKNKFWTWYSFGSYIYFWPSKFQLIYWPFTDPLCLFHCKKCHFTVFSHDFQKPPEDKLEATRHLLKSVRVVYDTGDYTTMPMFERLEIAEKIYQLWGRNDDEWCHFYRVKGYHLQKEKRQSEADAARQKALELARKLLADDSRAGERKYFHVVAAAMHHYLRDDKQALEDLRAARALTFQNPGMEEEKNRGYDEYLNGLIDEYIQAIETGRSTDEPEPEEEKPPKKEPAEKPPES
jgi:hypothetical protein